MTTPTWPSAINYLAERDSYSFQQSDPQLRSNFEFGTARTRRRFTRSRSLVSFSVLLSAEEFEWFKAFFHEDLLDGTRWFEMPVWLGDSYLRHNVRFTEPYQATYNSFRNMLVSVKLEIKEIAFVDEAFKSLMAEYGDTGLFDQFADPLQQIVNVDYPSATEDL